MLTLTASCRYSDEVKIAKSILLDGLILGYLSAYDAPGDLHPVASDSLELHTAGHALIKLAIIVMADFIA